MAIIGEALRQAFMPKHEYECIREEERAWGKLQRPLSVAFMAFVSLLFIICTIISLNIVFPSDIAKRPFCSDRRLQRLPVDVKEEATQSNDNRACDPVVDDAIRGFENLKFSGGFSSSAPWPSRNNFPFVDFRL
ncbi:hypothetical protein FEM48_Zijuj04G0078800 [Ziziphus jujuba var. spinosa]|uniref:Uncharacterized protein n=1 Tax=Ziziphus jujuba var. spinosa TaxID=714518 RepID=A0A978VIP1_ZIZJJ|nr:hypothetical protein FEM48_Zijuj04G0078800 [Ziziphus jujuba var. spinosa]